MLFSAIFKFYDKRKENVKIVTPVRMRKEFTFFTYFLVITVLGSDGLCNAPICSACAMITSSHHFCAMVEESKCCEEYNSAYQGDNKEENNLDSGVQFSALETVAICFVAIILVFLIVNSAKLCKLVSKERAFKKLECENMEIHL